MASSSMNEFEHLQVPLEEIISATNNFDRKRFIGGGGFGMVYKGALADGRVVAFKRLDRKYGQGDPEFWKEIRLLSRYTHQNLISLLGFCNQRKEMILVYEYASRGSLDGHLRSPNLTWTQRLRICLDAAKGLNHLHDPRETHQRVIHCDIKSANILLDDQWNAKVADFGLSKIGPANQQNSMLVTDALGTTGYCDPEFMKTYTLTKESDVYSFGVVLFEVLCGRICVEKINGRLNVLVSNWKKSYQENKLQDIIFQDLIILRMDQASLEIFSDIAFQCVNDSRDQRPAMSLVVQRLEAALKCQGEFEEILKSVASPLIFESPQDLKALLSKGLFVNGGKTWISLDHKEKMHKMISMAECLLPFDDRAQFLPKSNSRFEVGCYSTRGKNFKTRVGTHFLSPMVTYTVNLVYKLMDGNDVKRPGYLPLKYKIKGETKILIVYVANDEWLVTKLYEFTNGRKTIDLKFSFEDHSNGLEIEGIEFQPMENVEYPQVLGLQYEEILKEAAVVPLMYRSVDDVKVLFSKGVLINEGKKWFSINENGEHAEFLSIAECLVLDEGESYQYDHNYNSRFPVGALRESKCNFRTCLRPQLLSPHITYTVNLVFKYRSNQYERKQESISIIYQIEGNTDGSHLYTSYKREDNWWTTELCQFTSDGPTFCLDINFENSDQYVVVEGFEFEPLGKVGSHVLEDEEPMDIQLPVSASSNNDETYWEQKLPSDYQHIIKKSKDKLQWKTKKELYSIFSKGFLIVNNHSFYQRLANKGDQQWFSFDKSGKKCLTLSPRKACILEGPDYYKYTWQPLPESRFGDVLVIGQGFEIIILLQNGQHALSPHTRYGCYLIYKLPEDRYKGSVRKVSATTNTGSSEYWHVFMENHETPVVRPKVRENTYKRDTYNPAARKLKVEDLPLQRSDGWMEAKFHEFQMDTTKEVIPVTLQGTNVNRMMIQCVEIRQL